MKNFLSTFLKGSLTKVSTALLVIMQSPNVIADAMNASESFQTGLATPFNIGSIASAIGVIFGAYRSSKNYFQK